jgi:hypothetical protein
VMRACEGRILAGDQDAEVFPGLARLAHNPRRETRAERADARARVATPARGHGGQRSRG